MPRGFGDGWRDVDPSTLGANATPAPAPKRYKYPAKKTLVDGKVFDSKHESDVYLALKMEQAAGQITDLECQRQFPLVVTSARDGAPVLVGTITLDFAYKRNGQLEVAEAKVGATRRIRDYPLRKRLFEALSGLTVREM
jgi:hypothetical protein